MTNTNSSHDLFWLDEKRAVQWAALKKWLPDLKTALFFAKAYKLPVEKLSDLVFTLFNTPLFDELKTGVHSTDLQDYLVGLFPDVIHIQQDVTFSTEEAAPDDAFLQLIENAAVEIATSIQEVADSLGKVLHGLPGKSGEMVFENLAKLNVQRMSLGKFSAGIRHKPVAKTLVIFDVSGSMTKNTVTKIADAVVSMSYEVNASLAIVSYDTFVWNAGRFSTQEVLRTAQYGGTHYETLYPLLNEDWDVVITIADYDSSPSAKSTLASCTGSIGQVLDISLVNSPTFLSECVQQLATNPVKHLVQTPHRYVHSSF